MATLPKYLFIQLKRFLFGDLDDKIRTAVTFPTKLILDRNSTIFDENITKKIGVKKIRYNLLSIVCHGGGTGGGHYWAYAKDRSNNWYKYDDSRFSLGPIKIENVATQETEAGTPYILFYELDLEQKELLNPTPSLLEIKTSYDKEQTQIKEKQRKDQEEIAKQEVARKLALAAAKEKTKEKQLNQQLEMLKKSLIMLKLKLQKLQKSMTILREKLKA